MNERYSIEVDDEQVLIYGNLTIEESFDFMNFFEKKGYKSVGIGSENSSICMNRESIPEYQQAIKEIKEKNEDMFYKSSFESKTEECVKLNDKIKQLESLIKQIISDKSERIKVLEKVNEKLISEFRLKNLDQNPYVKKILEVYENGKNNEV